MKLKLYRNKFNKRHPGTLNDKEIEKYYRKGISVEALCQQVRDFKNAKAIRDAKSNEHTT